MPIPSWSPLEDDYLVQHWGLIRPSLIAKDISTRFGRYRRTTKAVVARSKRLRLRQRHTTTLTELAAETGYARSRLNTAIKRLGLQIRRVGEKRAHHAITAGQVDAIVKFLATIPDGQRLRHAIKGEWGAVGGRGGRKPARCIDCSRDDVPHFCHGRCRRCDQRWRKARSVAS